MPDGNLHASEFEWTEFQGETDVIDEQGQQVQPAASTGPRPAAQLNAAATRQPPPASLTQDGKPTPEQIGAWQQEAKARTQQTGTDYEYKGWMQGQKGVVPVIGLKTPVEQQEIVAGRMQQRQADINRAMEATRKSQEQQRQASYRGVELEAQGIIGKEDAGYAQRQGLSPEEYHAQVMKAPAVKGHAYTTYSDTERRRFENHIADMKARKEHNPISGQREYERNKQDFENQIRFSIKRDKQKEWEQTKFEGKAQELEMQRVQTDAAKLALQEKIERAPDERAMRKAELELKQLEIEEKRAEPARRAAAERLKTQQKMIQQLESGKVTPDAAYDMVMNRGAGMSEIRAEEIAKTLPDELEINGQTVAGVRQKFIDAATANMASVTEGIPVGTGEPGEPVVSKVTSREISTATETVRKMVASGQDVASAITAVSKDSPGLNAELTVKMQGDLARADRTTRAAIAQFVADTNRQVAQVSERELRLSGQPQSQEQLVARYFPDFTGLKKANPDDIEAAVRNRMINDAATSGGDAAAATMTKMLSDKSPLDMSKTDDPRLAVQAISQRLTAVQEGEQYKDSAAKVDTIRKTAARYQGLPPGSIGAAATKDGMVTFYTGQDPKWETVLERQITAAHKSGPEAVARLEMLVGKQGDLLAPYVDERTKQTVAAMRFEKVADMVPGMPEAAVAAAQNLYTTGSQYTVDLITNPRPDLTHLALLESPQNQEGFILHADAPGSASVEIASEWKTGYESPVKLATRISDSFDSVVGAKIDALAAGTLLKKGDTESKVSIDVLKNIDFGQKGWGGRQSAKWSEFITGDPKADLRNPGELIVEKIKQMPDLQKMWYSKDSVTMKKAFYIAMKEVADDASQAIYDGDINGTGAVSNLRRMNESLTQTIQKLGYKSFGDMTGAIAEMDTNEAAAAKAAVSDYIDMSSRIMDQVERSQDMLRKLGQTIQFESDPNMNKATAKLVDEAFSMYRRVIGAEDQFTVGASEAKRAQGLERARSSFITHGRM